MYTKVLTNNTNVQQNNKFIILSVTNEVLSEYLSYCGLCKSCYSQLED